MLKTNIITQLQDKIPDDLFTIWPHRFLLAVSGGRDSMFLLQLFIEMMHRYNHFYALVCYIDHGIREDTNKEIKIIQQVTNENNLDFVKLAVNVPAVSKKVKKSIEETGRWVRYKKFSKLCTLNNLEAICTAHHSDDYFESILMHFIRGGGKSALNTMPLFHKNESNIMIFRPLMYLNQELITDLVNKYKTPFVEDPSNASNKYTRNRIRKNIMPSLIKEGLNTTKIWKNFHSFGFNFNIKTTELKPIEYISINRDVFCHSLHSFQSLKNLLDPFLKSMGLYPANSSLLSQIQKQALKPEARLMNIFYKNKNMILYATHSGPIWIFCRKAACLTPFIVKLQIGSNSHATKKIYYNNKDVLYELKENVIITQFEDGMRYALKTGGRKKIKKIFQEKRIPKPIRNYIPILYNVKTKLVERLCLSFWEEKSDAIF